jgi:hypothetical protein
MAFDPTVNAKIGASFTLVGMRAEVHTRFTKLISMTVLRPTNNSVQRRSRVHATLNALIE